MYTENSHQYEYRRQSYESIQDSDYTVLDELSKTLRQKPNAAGSKFIHIDYLAPSSFILAENTVLARSALFPSANSRHAVPE